MRLRVTMAANRAPSPWELYSLVLLVGAAVYIPLAYAVDWLPELHSPLRYVGMACPLCGGTRAVTAAALGRVGTALMYNPLALLVLLLLLWGAFSYLFLVLPRRRRVVLETTRRERIALWAIALALLLANWAWVLWSGMYEEPLVI